MDPRDPAVPELLLRGRIEITGRIVDASNATLFGTVSADGLRGRVRLQAGARRAPAVGLPRRHARRPRSRARSSSRRRRASTSCRTPCTAKVRSGPGWCRSGWRPTTSAIWWTSARRRRCRPAGSACCAPVARGASPPCSSTPTRPRCGGWRRSTSWSTTPTARAATCSRAPTATSTASTTASPCTSRTSCARCSGAGSGSRCPTTSIEGLEKLRAELDGAFCDVLGEHVTRREVRTLSARVDALLTDPRYPEPSGYGPAIPWPAFTCGTCSARSAHEPYALA